MECLSALLLAGFSSTGTNEIIEFSGRQCIRCVQVKPTVDKFIRQGHPIRVLYWEDQQSKPEYRRYGIRTFPTFVLIRNGKEINRSVNYISESTLRSWVQKITPKTAAVPGHVASTKKLGSAEPFPGSAAPATPPPSAGSNFGPKPATNTAQPFAATVRIRVRGVDKMNQGAGTVIRSKPGEAIVLTCSHLFYRELKRVTAVTVDVFSGENFRSFPAELIRMDKNPDVAVIRVQTQGLLETAKLSTGIDPPAKGASVMCVGCGGGRAPKQIAMQVTRLNFYPGPQNIECTTMPIEGRSGGGLFNAAGELVGICIAANQKLVRGVYTGLKPIRELITAAKIDAAPSKPAPVEPPTYPLVKSEPKPKPAPPTAKAPDRPIIPPTQPPVELNGDSEVICIVRPIDNPNAPSRVVIINKATQKFVRYLNLELDGQPKPTSRAELIGKPSLPSSFTRSRMVPRVKTSPAGKPQRYIRRVW